MDGEVVITHSRQAAVVARLAVKIINLFWGGDLSVYLPFAFLIW